MPCLCNQSFSWIWCPVMGSCSWLDWSRWEVSRGCRVELEGALQVASRRREVAAGGKDDWSRMRRGCVAWPVTRGMPLVPGKAEWVCQSTFSAWEIDEPGAGQKFNVKITSCLFSFGSKHPEAQRCNAPVAPGRLARLDPFYTLPSATTWKWTQEVLDLTSH